jgi:hypothetical protein
MSRIRINSFKFNVLYLIVGTTLFFITVLEIYVYGTQQIGGKGFIEVDALKEKSYHSNEHVSLIINLIMAYSINVGLLAPFLVVGMIGILNQKTISDNKEIMLIIFLLAIPFIVDINYFNTFFLLFLCIIISQGILFTLQYLKDHNEKIVPYMILLIFVICPVLPEFITFQEIGKNSFDDLEISQISDTGLYMQESINGMSILHGPLYCPAAYGNGLTIYDYNTDLLVHDTIPLEMLEIEFDYSFSKLAEGEKTFFSVKDWTDEGTYYTLKRPSQIYMLEYDSIEAEYLLRPYNISYSFQIGYSVFSNSYQDKTYKIYENNLQSGWYIKLD